MRAFPVAPPEPMSDRRWLALLVLCLGDLMIVLDVTIVGVSLPSIGADLGFSEESLAWVVNAYLITFGGFLLLGGRLGDLLGHRSLFLAGVGLFTTASAVCGLAGSQGMLVAARAVQGVGGAVVSAVALSLTMTLFTEPAERARAMGIFGFVASGGGSLGVPLAASSPTSSPAAPWTKSRERCSHARDERRKEMGKVKVSLTPLIDRTHPLTDVARLSAISSKATREGRS